MVGRASGTCERGAAVVDFVLVAGLVTVLFLALVQLALLLHVRNTVADAASSAARYGALADRTAAEARERADYLVRGGLGPGYAHEVSAVVEPGAGGNVLTVTITAPMPLIGLLGPARALEVSGHAVMAK
ncbi:TadE/TadG family type IV pilus assembly protein [Specibacter cremeus]|uniref:TadE/TadG family type IV pilus assembly protein n=1 Tax=Specibacter cremeus TaxID=1629051 RepID=UPI000F7A114E|nr:TadE/TadG family type IV pilus assembly protein [Specibacter cremeus]